jgi:DNA-binding MarR family transcriptional regulator
VQHGPPGGDGAVDELSFAITSVARTVRGPRLFAKLSREAKVSVPPQLLLLFARIAETQPVRIAALAEVMGLDRSTISRQVSELVEAGYAARLPDPADGRGLFVQLTPDGERAQSAVLRAWTRVLEDATREWSPDDRAGGVRLLARLSESMERVLEE